MRFVDKKQKLDYLILLISKEEAYNADLLSQKIFVSKRTLIRYIVELRELGFEIGYCNLRKRYYFIKESKTTI
jgi:predicted DNA-binding transcriptional regulator YafY